MLELVVLVDSVKRYTLPFTNSGSRGFLRRMRLGRLGPQMFLPPPPRPPSRTCSRVANTLVILLEPTVLTLSTILLLLLSIRRLIGLLTIVLIRIIRRGAVAVVIVPVLFL